MRKTTTLRNKINEKGVAKAIGKNIQNVFTAIFEIMDNSVSNLYSVVQKEKNIYVDIKEIDNDTVKIRIEDNGTGIENLDTFTSLGNKTHQTTSRNCHGFGIKNVINSMSVKDGTILTRTRDDAAKNAFVEIKKKNFTLKSAKATMITDETWPGYFETGTIVDLDFERAMFNSASNMISGRKARINYKRTCAFIFETIGFILANDILNGINIIFSAIDMNNNILAENIPVCVYNYKIEKDFIPLRESVITKDFGRGIIKATFRAGILTDNTPRGTRYTPFSNEVPMLYGRVHSDLRSGNGAVLTINGRRMIERIPIKELFGRCWHPSLNHLYTSIELESDDLDALPQTTPAKNGYVSDCVIENICYQMRELYTPNERDFPGLNNTLKTGWELLGTLYRNTHKRDARFFYSTDVCVGDSRLPLIVHMSEGTIVYEGEKTLIGRKELYGILGHYDDLVNACENENPPFGIDFDISNIRFVVMLHREPTPQILNAIEDLKIKHNFHIEIEYWHEYDIIY